MKALNKLHSQNNSTQHEGANAESTGDGWKSAYKICGLATLIAGIVFRRNIGAEIFLVTGQSSPGSVIDWFTLLQSNSLLGLSFLNIFDVIDYALVGLMFLGLYGALRRTNQGHMTIATGLALTGVTTYFATNPAFSLLSLSDQYATATTEMQKSTFLVAGEAVLAVGHGTGVYVSLLLLAVAGLIVSVVMLQSKIFSKLIAYIGIAASVLDLTYCITSTIVLSLDALLMSAAGLALMIWHILVGRKLYLLGRTQRWKR